MKYITEKIFIGFFIVFLISIPALSFLVQEEDFSLFEFRNLAEVPEYKPEKLFNTEYYNEWESYFNDHVFARTKLLSFHTKLNMKLRKPVINDTVITEDGLLPFNGFPITSHKELTQALEPIEENIVRLRDACNKYNAKFFVVGIPEQSSMLFDSYPELLKLPERKRLAQRYFFPMLEKNNIDYINMYDHFSKLDYKQYYSKVDHHYNYFGAYETYTKIVDKISEISEFKIIPLSKEEIDFVKIDLPFHGSRSRKLFGAYSNSENLYIGYPKEKISFTRTDEGVEQPAEVFKLPTEDYATYPVYMGGDVGETIIRTGRDEYPNVLLIGDSFTNPIETLLYYHCNQFHTLDFRYYKYCSAEQYLHDARPDIVIYLRDDGSMYMSDGNGEMNFHMDDEK